MNSPVTGKQMILTTEKRFMNFKKETFEIVFHFYKCTDSGEKFTSTTLDELNINELYNHYRNNRSSKNDILTIKSNKQ